MLRRFIEYYRPWKGLFLLDFSCAVLAGLLELGFPMAVKLFIDRLLPTQQWPTILLATMGLLFVYLLNTGLMAVVVYWGHKLGINIETEMRRRSFDHLQKLSFRFYDNNKTGHLLARVTKDLEEIGEVAHHGPEDLFIVVISGGSSALMSCPIDGISLQDEIDTTDVLLKSGAGIYEINAVRRHISALNGGMLAKRIQDVGAELIGFGISDAVGSPATGDIAVPYAAYKSTPIGPDATTLDDARATIVNYDVAERLPKSVVDYLMNAGPDKETPKAFPDNTYFLLNTLPDSCTYAKEACEEMGIPAVIVTSFLEGESRDAGTFFAAMAREIQSMMGMERLSCHLAQLTLADGPRLELIQFLHSGASPQARPLSAGSGHVGLTVENVDEALREVAALGAVAIGDVTVFPEGRSAYCREPGGSFLELLEFNQDGG